MLALAAVVTLSTMHQSSLGSLFLLMPDKLAPQWWSPVMPISFFLSAIAAGMSLIILIEMWIAKGWKRPLRMDQLAAMGKITFYSLLVYLVFRLGDMAVRGQFAGAFSGSMGALFITEILLGGLVPLALLSRAALRARPGLLFAGIRFSRAMGVTFNRLNISSFCRNARERGNASSCTGILLLPPSSSGEFRLDSSPQPYSYSGSQQTHARYSPTHEATHGD